MNRFFINLSFFFLQRSILRSNNYSIYLYQSDIDLLSSSNLIDLFVEIHSTRKQSDEFYGLDKSFQNRPNLFGEFYQLNNHHYDALFYYDQVANKTDSSKLIQSLRLCGFNHLLENYLQQLSTKSDGTFFRIELTSILTGHQQLSQWKTFAQEKVESIRDRILSIIHRSIHLSNSISSSLSTMIDDQLWTNVSDISETSLVNVLQDVSVNYLNLQRLTKLWNDSNSISFKEHYFDFNDEILLTRIAATEKLLIHQSDQKQIDFIETKQKLLANLVTKLCQNAFECKKFQVEKPLLKNEQNKNMNFSLAL